MGYTLRRVRLGALPLLDQVARRLGLAALLDRAVPTADRRCRVAYAARLGVLIRSIALARLPLYRVPDALGPEPPAAWGLPPGAAPLTDDACGRALDALFDADRGSLLTAVACAAVQRFGLDCAELHNDSTTVRFTGTYPAARGRRLRGQRAPWITFGHSKDHRPDLKQLTVLLSTTADGSVPIQFRCADGQANDATTHIASWEACGVVAGRPDFLYVADSKLCTRDNLDHLDRHRGRFVTVLPRSRAEDAEFRAGLQTHPPAWELVWDRPHPRRPDGPRDRWHVCHARTPSKEGWPVIWVYSELLALHQGERRRERLARVDQTLQDWQRKLAGPRPRWRAAAELQRRADALLAEQQVAPYVAVRVTPTVAHSYRQARPGRPGPDTPYRRRSRPRLALAWTLDDAAIARDQRSDGMYPLLTNDRALTPRQVLEAHKRQPFLERRFCEAKSVLAIAPVFLKNEGRIEALFTCYYFALLLLALLERDLRRAMQRAGLAALPLYPEGRPSTAPTAEQILRLFADVERQELWLGACPLQVFHPEWTPLQQRVLDLLEVPLRAYRR